MRHMTISIPKRYALAILPVALLFGCTQNALETAAKINGQYADGLTAVQQVARRAHETHKSDGTLMLSDENYGRWIDIGIALNQGGKDVNNFLRMQAKLSPEQRVKASMLIGNLAQTVDHARTQDLVTISDAGGQQQMQNALGMVQAALNSASVALALGGN